MKYVIIFALVVFSSNVKVMALTPINALSPAYAEKVNITAFKILKSLFEESKKIALGKNIIENAVQLSKESIDDEIKELKQFVEETIDDAKEDALDLEPCLNRTNIKHINIDAAFNRCKMPVQFKQIESQKSEIAKISGSFPEEVNVCIIASVLLRYDLENCLDLKIQEMERKMIRISATIEALLTVAAGNSARCTEQTLRVLDAVVTKAAREFEDCADEVDYNSD